MQVATRVLMEVGLHGDTNEGSIRALIYVSVKKVHGFYPMQIHKLYTCTYYIYIHNI